MSDREEKIQLLRSDLQMIRVLEDLIDLLLQKHVVNLTDFPLAVQKKLLERKDLRSALGEIIDEAEEEAIP